MHEQIAELWVNFPAYLGGHILLSVAALAIGMAISLPLGIAASFRPRLAESTLAIAGVIQTVPSLALLGLMVFVLGGLIGFWPALLALVLYSVLPMLANTVIGIRGVDPILTEAARGLGMSDGQMLWRVQLPLAAPVILGGIRTATVWVVGTATLATGVGGMSLGNYITAGLQMLNHTALVFGCVSAALLAVLLDQLIHLLEVSARRRSRRMGLAAVAALLLVMAAGLYEPVSRWLAGRNNQAVVAAGEFTEQYILSHALASRLESAGFHADRREGMSDGIRLEALRRGQVDCLVEYTGDIWTLLMKRQDFKNRTDTLHEVTDFLEKDFGVICAGPLGFEDNYALAMPKQKAQDLKITSINDIVAYAAKLAAQGQDLKVGGDSSFFERPEWRGLVTKYKLPTQNLRIVPISQTLMYGAVVAGQVDVIGAYTSDGRVKEFNLKLLTDPQQAFPPYDAILLVSRAAAARPGFLLALKPFIDAIDVDTMQEANLRVDIQAQSPRRVAAWLLETIEANQRHKTLQNKVTP